MTQRWGRTVLLVSDHDAAVEFYSRAFGFEVLIDSGEPGSDAGRLVHLGHDGVGSLWLLLAEGDDAVRVGHQAGGQPFGMLYVDDLAATLDALAAAGGTLTAGPAGDGSTTWAHVEDLYGNEIVLLQTDTPL